MIFIIIINNEFIVTINFICSNVYFYYNNIAIYWMMPPCYNTDNDYRYDLKKKNSQHMLWIFYWKYLYFIFYLTLWYEETEAKYYIIWYFTLPLSPFCTNRNVCGGVLKEKGGPIKICLLKRISSRVENYACAKT